MFDSEQVGIDNLFLSPCLPADLNGPLAVDLGLDGQVLGCTAVEVDGDGPTQRFISVDAVYAATPWPEAQVMLNPKVFGVVNMDTWAWHDPDAETELTARVQTTDLVTGEPLTLTVTARLVGWCHHFDDDRGERPRFVAAAVDCPRGHWTTESGVDDERGGAAEHVYEDLGFFTTTVEQQWVGEATLVGPAPQTWALGPVTRTFQREYQVNEIIGVLTG